MRTAWGSYPPSPTNVSQSGPSEKHTPAVGSFRRGGKQTLDTFPPPCPLGFQLGLADVRQGSRLVGRAAAGYLHIKSSFASDPLSPFEQEVARFNCSFKGSPGLVSAEILGLTLPPPSALPPRTPPTPARNWCASTRVLKEDANQLFSVLKLICIC